MGPFFGGLFIAFPEAGIVIVLGYLAATVISGTESDTLSDGFGSFGSALASIGISIASSSRYQESVASGRFLVMAHCSAKDADRAKVILDAAGPHSVFVHPGSLAADSSPPATQLQL